jgi:hypothetical protein
MPSQRVTVRIHEDLLLYIDDQVAASGTDRTTVILAMLRYAEHHRWTPATGLAVAVEILSGDPGKPMLPEEGTQASVYPLHAESQTEENFGPKTNFPSHGTTTSEEQAEAWEGLESKGNVVWPLNPDTEKGLDRQPMSEQKGTQATGAPVGEGSESQETIPAKLKKCPKCGAALIPWGQMMRCRSCEENF